MSVRYGVFNPEGEEFESPSEARAAQLRMALLSQQMLGGGSGAPGSTSSAPGYPMDSNRGYRPVGGGGVGGGDDVSLRDQVQAKRDLMKEQVYGDLQLGQQRNQGNLDLAGVSNDGMNYRADVAIKPQMGRLDYDNKAYNDQAPVRDAANAKAKFEGGVYGELAGGGGGFTPEQKLVALGRDPRMARDPSLDRRDRMEEAQANAFIAAEPERAGEVMGLLSEGRLAEYKPTKRFDAHAADESQQAQNLPEVQQSLMGVADYISSVSGWWSQGNLAFVKDRIDRTKAALQNARVSPAAAEMVMQRLNNLISNSLEAEGWDANGADKVREMIGLSPHNDAGSAAMNAAMTSIGAYQAFTQ